MSRTYHVLSVVVNKEVNRIPYATIIMLDGTPAEETFSISNTEDFIPGKELEIKAGYRTDEETIFKGIVIKHSIKIRKNSSVLVVECKDAAVKMTISPRSKYFKEIKDSDVMEELAERHGLETDIEETSFTHKELVQYNTTDWDFILSRADVNGLLCLPDDGKLTIGKPDFSAETVLSIQYGATIHNLDAEIDARLQFKAVKAKAWHPADQELASGVEADEPEMPEAGNISAETLADVMGEDEFELVHGGNIQDGELQEWANAKMMKQRLAKIRGSVTTDGTSEVVPGNIIELNGVGERFEGRLFVTGVRQQIENGMWQTSMQFGIDPQWFAQKFETTQPMAGAMLPAIQGLQIGIVTQLESDPDGEDRIMVKIPVIQNEDEGIWCRVCTLDAGENRGTFFRPEIGDEVVVGFLNNDPRQAMILGMLNSSSKPAPLQASNDNHEKGYVSRSEMKMLFNDDKKTLTLETPAGNKFLLSEEDQGIQIEDQNGNKITMDTTGITGESIGNLTLQINSGNITLMDGAGNSVAVEAGGITVQSAAKVTLQASQVEISAAQLSVSAAMATFSGVLQANTIIATAGVVSPLYTPGAGNIL